jgi:hypothetical protein
MAKFCIKINVLLTKHLKENNDQPAWSNLGIMHYDHHHPAFSGEPTQEPSCRKGQAVLPQPQPPLF